MPAMLRSRRCAWAIRLGRRNGIQVRGELGDQILGRHDVARSHEMISRNKRGQPTENCGRVKRWYEDVIRSETCETWYARPKVWDMRWKPKHETNTVRRQRFTYLLKEEVAYIPNVGRSIVTPKGSVRPLGSLGRSHGVVHSLPGAPQGWSAYQRDLE